MPLSLQSYADERSAIEWKIELLSTDAVFTSTAIPRLATGFTPLQQDNSLTAAPFASAVYVFRPAKPGELIFVSAEGLVETAQRGASVEARSNLTSQAGVALHDHETNAERNQAVQALVETSAVARVSDKAENELDRRLETFARTYGNAGVSAVAEVVRSRSQQRVGNLITLVRAVGRLSDYATTDARLKLLTELLVHPSEQMRDAAGLAIVDLGDPRGAQILAAAATAETNIELRELLEAGARELGYGKGLH